MFYDTLTFTIFLPLTSILLSPPLLPLDHFHNPSHQCCHPTIIHLHFYVHYYYHSHDPLTSLTTTPIPLSPPPPPPSLPLLLNTHSGYNTDSHHSHYTTTSLTLPLLHSYTPLTTTTTIPTTHANTHIQVMALTLTTPTSTLVPLLQSLLRPLLYLSHHHSSQPSHFHSYTTPTLLSPPLLHTHPPLPWHSLSPLSRHISQYHPSYYTHTLPPSHT